MNPTIRRAPEESDRLLLIVVGAHLRAEAADRPLAYDLREQIDRWLSKQVEREAQRPLVLVCCDIWYVNQDVLHRHPLICLGEPSVNALSAHLANRLTPALVRDQKLTIQLDPQFNDLRVCLWGVNSDLTSEALALFESRYLDAFLHAALDQQVGR
jgi:hypothetical protein